ncbi:hypothetical protein ACTWLT_28040 [Micromonospora sp. ZYX-F-536]|uniref:hypothetical protein n=1 Tax=Micromonospora sp. ZYX-F-536 TaxID=3457629 RepID=UPI004040C074
MAGEIQQLAGFDGLRRAKEWLDASTRVAHAWTVKDDLFRELLEFEWPHGGKGFSFDIGGKLRGGSFHDNSFVAEIKNYKRELDLPEHFRSFLAKCYISFKAKPNRCNHMMWISWSPFQARKWDSHTTPDNVREAVIHHREMIFGTTDEEEARKAIDETAVFETAQRLWMITLCEKQEQLVISNDHLDELVKFMRVSERAV